MSVLICIADMVVTLVPQCEWY